MRLSAAAKADPDRIASLLNNVQRSKDIRLSAYGYIRWVVEHYGYKAAYPNIINSAGTVDGYANEAAEMRDNMPVLLLNAADYTAKVTGHGMPMEMCLEQLEGMSFPYVLYILFAGGGHKDEVAKYKEETAEVLKRYPSLLDKLPDSYKKTGEELNAHPELSRVDPFGNTR